MGVESAARQHRLTTVEEVVKARGDIGGLRTEVASLKDRVKQVEKDERESLEKVIAVLRRILEAEEK